MGSESSKKVSSQYAQYLDKYKSFDELSQAMRSAGIESIQLVVGFDFSKSNNWTGERTYGKPLHDLSYFNPYMQVLKILEPIIMQFDDDGLIPAFRFGCIQTRDQCVWPLLAPQVSDPHFKGFSALLEGYKLAVQQIQLSGPTTFAPMVKQAVEISKAYGHKQLMVCIIMTDGDVSDVKADLHAIAEASQFPICFSAVGLGDGPFDNMQTFDDNQKGRQFDNFQFVNFTEMAQKINGKCENPELALACAVFNEVPDAVKSMRKLGIFK